jgi:hypothetical protein
MGAAASPLLIVLQVHSMSGIQRSLGPGAFKESEYRYVKALKFVDLCRFAVCYRRQRGGCRSRYSRA